MSTQLECNLPIQLTKKQTTILNSLHENYLTTNKEISAKMGITEKGVRHHITILNKVFGTNNRFKLLEAYREKILKVEGKVL